ncbi:MAG TPA: hypothetical protein VG742_20005 [Dongiaceae bacterium]|nr:hypothetical protein [Dongiaceae bacterium]
MASRNRRGDGELWGAEGADNLWTGDAYEVAIISKQTGKPPIEVRRAIMKVGANRRRIIAELSGQAPASHAGR